MVELLRHVRLSHRGWLKLARNFPLRGCHRAASNVTTIWIALATPSIPTAAALPQWLLPEPRLPSLRGCYRAEL